MPALPPSSTIPSGHNPLSVRQNDDSSSSFTAVPTAYKSADNSLAPGVVAGIVLGSVAGFLLLLYIIYMLLHRGPVVRTVDGASTVVSGGPMSTVTGDTSTYLSFRSRRDRRTRNRSRSRATSRSKRTRSRTTVNSRDRSRRRTSPLVSDSRGERIIVDPPAPRFVQESTISSDNEIVVEEEHSVSPPRRSRRQSQDRYRREPLMGEGYRRDYSPRDYSPRRESRRYSRDR
ncbi:hypothetical protein FOQG_05852 [Fusarium oxysporum f. sp. raphani 54005]|jgi:hypothetical protein|uniref:Uncharacterized protein n=13 Tax=Fusarium oxysporum TaxID=5507 RepID=A0A2H3TSG7_FUSOX|nr:uncharacterized protein FOBCDRAFT_220045 [Fusarium oxysporum Fo47]EGU84285.1 hypothetical protein FOXB_05242 [Fusarium oxysporum f. sp. conglutinans Fo5176]ENH69179.1 hypothetical protein FOC1_g10010355 [Fusarium oxysporum f. sp. cubense race 1]EXA01564.1 hypothetical protein FOWG_01378 [Fusarium oxysporum f. sp. lycopersici MN25]EXK92849.1 hypothetical protein FOQG_05852 [Fusarium oxysporum f. sp. raphani 54005]EXL60247.1 hypothetical protein FOCG_03179 [Fusarium oxysporum f. sp. radicis-l